MQNHVKNILFGILILSFLILVFFKTLPIISNPEANILSVKNENNIYKIKAILKNGNKVKVFDNTMILSPEYKFDFEIIKHKNNYIIIESQNRWGLKNKQIFYLEHFEQS